MSGLKNKLTTQGSNLSNLNGGVTPNNFAALQGSQQHDTYSINNIPVVPNKPAPSGLDLDGQVPPYNYADNAPEGATF